MAFSVLLHCLLFVITTFTLVTKTTLALPEVIRIGEFTFQMFIPTYLLSNFNYNEKTNTGGLFDSSDPMPESAFRQALDRINENGRFLPKSNLVSLSERLPPNDSHFASRRGEFNLILVITYMSIFI